MNWNSPALRKAATKNNPLFLASTLLELLWIKNLAPSQQNDLDKFINMISREDNSNVLFNLAIFLNCAMHIAANIWYSEFYITCYYYVSLNHPLWEKNFLKFHSKILTVGPKTRLTLILLNNIRRYAEDQDALTPKQVKFISEFFWIVKESNQNALNNFMKLCQVPIIIAKKMWNG